MMKTIIGFDTATHACSVALSYQGQVIERFEIAPRRHTDLLLPMIDSLLAQAGIAKSAIDFISYGQGPGSFMGVRLATAVAQGLGFGLNRALIPLSTLRILAQTALLNQDQMKVEHVYVGWDARMQEMYLGEYRQNQQGLMQLQGKEQLCSPQEIILPAKIDSLVGNGWQEYAMQLPVNVRESKVRRILEVYPYAAAAVQLAQAEIENAIPAEKAEPVYLRNRVTN